MVTIQKAEENDLEPLRLCAISAFIDDERCKPGDAKPGIPPGNDKIRCHRNWLRNHDYFKCVVHDKIAGGCVVKTHPKHKELFGIFLCRTFIGKGIGSRLLRGVMNRYPTGSLWVLETPDYSIRSHRFYERNSFVLAKKIKPDPRLGYGFFVYKNIGPQQTSQGSG